MDVQTDVAGLLNVHIIVLAAFAGWVIIGRAPSILHAPLTTGCAFLNSIIVVAGLYLALNAGTRAEQIAGFCAVLFAAAGAAGAYGVGMRGFAMFAPRSSKPAAPERGRAKRVSSKPRRTKKI